jgi:hypothetical protein
VYGDVPAENTVYTPYNPIKVWFWPTLTLYKWFRSTNEKHVRTHTALFHPNHTHLFHPIDVGAKRLVILNERAVVVFMVTHELSDTAS